ncbi:MAG: DUF4387 domain-containing protein [Bullifex sp.]|nr:DUF4387 domain-containing protein [Spirochaetales bacterium]MDY3849609.1 DUF4387 domain-containing protein [Bullifex sp.]MDD7009307.1 DUF4387 domain-containing protein [Spirochaetales bacterium]MDD7535264.1 DUF4387 domain-containing protein [Spirochaetales bacterium]MDY4799888.1 DUF4387 domain-containing protein [Bullifex sp.]
MTKLVELAKVLRSKNSGPFQITLDVLFDSRENYERVVRSGVINRENICRAYNLQDKDITEVVFFDSAMGIKVTFNRKISSGSAFDRDVYGAQQHAPLMEFIIP